MSIQQLPILSLLIWTPILGGFWVLYAGNRELATSRYLSFLIALITFSFSVYLLLSFDPAHASYQFVERTDWIPSFSIEYYVGVDGISLLLIVLNCFMTLLVIVSSWDVIEHQLAEFQASFLILAGLMNGVFVSLDALLFYVFWEALLIPMFLVIGIWGGPNRVYATIKFFLYTFLGSVFLLLAVLYLYSKGGTFAIPEMHVQSLTLIEQMYLFIAFLLAFAVKIPMWPVHTWLPDAHVEAPTAGSVILAALMLKLGGYGFYRFSLPIAPDASSEMATFMVVLSLIAIVYIGFVALVQKDMKKLIAYSSVSHMGFVTLGLFVGFMIAGEQVNETTVLALEGAMVQMISHGLISAALFFCIGILYHRMQTRLIHDYGGVANVMPLFTAFVLLFCMANVGLPGTSGFIGEFLIILSSYQADFWIAFIAALTLIIGAAYSLWMFKRVFWGEIANASVELLKDVQGNEFLILLVLAFVILLLGIWPAPLFTIMDASMSQMVAHVLAGKIP